MKNKWLGLVILLPVVGACSDTDLAKKLSSESVSKEQIETISNNIETLYPDASDELKYNAADVAVRAIENLVFVEGGSFEMGDFGAPCEIPSGTVHRMDWSPDAECLSSPTSVETGSVHLHTVMLDSYSMSAYETTLIDMEWMRQINGLPVAADFTGNDSLVERGSDIYDRMIDTMALHAAPTRKWQEAKDYCIWLSDITEQTFDLPTEAQWEYTARSRGENYYFPTNNGYRQLHNDSYFNPNTGYYEEYEDNEVNSSTRIGPVNKYPPNQIGVYGMSNQVSEWVNDWYSPSYYLNSPEQNPQGPASGTKKVLRDGAGTTMTTSRLYSLPDKGAYFPSVSFRCSVQH